MDNKKFAELCIKTVVDYFNSHVEKTDNKKINEDDVFIVRSCKTLQNNKALVSTTVSDGLYYEITHNGDKNETYVDVYKKWENFVVERELKEEPSCKKGDIEENNFESSKEHTAEKTITLSESEFEKIVTDKCAEVCAERKVPFPVAVLVSIVLKNISDKLFKKGGDK